MPSREPWVELAEDLRQETSAAPTARWAAMRTEASYRSMSTPVAPRTSVRIMKGENSVNIRHEAPEVQWLRVASRNIPSLQARFAGARRAISIL